MNTEFAFTLPRGYVDASGAVHREGVMRLATARDEIEPLRDAEVRRNEAYLAVLLLSRVVTRIGSVSDVTPDVIEACDAARKAMGEVAGPPGMALASPDGVDVPIELVAVT